MKTFKYLVSILIVITVLSYSFSVFAVSCKFGYNGENDETPINRQVDSGNLMPVGLDVDGEMLKDQLPPFRGAL